VIALRLIELEIEIIIFSNERGGAEEFSNNFHANNFKSGVKKGRENPKATAINSAFKADIQIITIQPNLNKEQVEI
jgi:hypothetical protein